MAKTAGQNEISQKFLDGSDLGDREEEVLKDACQQTGFKPEKLMRKSRWWSSHQIGAFHYLGTFKDKKTVLKIQGVKPEISEAYMIESFAKANKSEILRPPYLYTTLPWNEEKRYEALVLEYVDGPQAMNIPTDKEGITKFYQLYQDYRTNCLSSPWLKKPKETISEKIVDSFDKWRKISFQIYPDHPLVKKDDSKLIDQAIQVLRREYQGIETTFQHGHLREDDLYKIGNQYVLLSNLFWSWRPPLYDAVFCYHGFIYKLIGVENITPEKVEEQRKLWFEQMYALPQAQGENKRLLELALLERAAAGLNLDALMYDPKSPIVFYLVEATRQQIKTLLSHFV